jgi:hypothetical protein
MTIERPMFPPIDPTRRRFLSQAAGVAAGGAVLALATIPPALAAAAQASPLDQEDPAIIALGERIEPLLAAYRNAAEDRLKARANAEAACPAVPQELVCYGPPTGYAVNECDVEGNEIEEIGVSQYGFPLGPRQILSSERAREAIAGNRLYFSRRTRRGKQIAKQIEIAERYEAERVAAIERSGLLAAIDDLIEAAFELEDLAYEASAIEPRTMAGVLIQARALSAYAEAEIVMGHHRGRAGQVVGLALAQSVSRMQAKIAA